MIRFTDWKRYSDLKADIIYDDYLYYGLDDPKTTDREYDRKLKEFEALEEKFPMFRSPDSPTQVPGHNRFNNGKLAEDNNLRQV